MATTPATPGDCEVEYPTSDGRPMAETDTHRQVMVDLIATLQDHFADDPLAYVSGNLLLYYERGNKRARVAPDVFVVRGVPKLPPRNYYLLWREGKAPDVVIEVTSRKTRSEDRKKWMLYQDVLRIPEYFLFDPREEYLKPSLQGCRLRRRRYIPIEPIFGRLPSMGLGLHLERKDTELRLHDPANCRRLLTLAEQVKAAETARVIAAAEASRLCAEGAQYRAETRALIAEEENERLRREIEALQSKLSAGS
jgi:Uma2 family endonuclease